MEHVLTDGEDFELIFTVPPSVTAELDAAKDLPTPITRIGWVQTGAAAALRHHGPANSG